MKHIFAFLSLASASALFAQPRFEIPLTINDGVMTQMLYFGILPGAHYCIDQRDSMNGHVEFFIPLVPPSGVFDARLISPRSGSDPLCFAQGGWYDFRPFRSIIQKDTFRVRSQLGMGTTMVISWPANLATRFTQLSLRYFDQIAVNNVTVNMLTDTSADVTNAGDPATVTIFAGEEPQSVEQAPRDVPETFALCQNYPNPFNPGTTISYQISDYGWVSLRVYNVLGQEAATLVNEVKQPGRYEVTWDAREQPSGVYFCRLLASEMAITQRMILTR